LIPLPECITPFGKSMAEGMGRLSKYVELSHTTFRAQGASTLCLSPEPCLESSVVCGLGHALQIRSNRRLVDEDNAHGVVDAWWNPCGCRPVNSLRPLCGPGRDRGVSEDLYINNESGRRVRRDSALSRKSRPAGPLFGAESVWVHKPNAAVSSVGQNVGVPIGDQAQHFRTFAIRGSEPVASRV
jgi:hypothetical protein